MADFPALALDLNELAAFDAMRAFVEACWVRGLKGDDGLASLLGNLSRSVREDQSTADPAMWRDWKDAVALIRAARGGATVDPQGPSLANGSQPPIAEVRDRAEQAEGFRISCTGRERPMMGRLAARLSRPLIDVVEADPTLENA